MASRMEQLRAQLIEARMALAAETVEVAAGEVRVVMSGTQECRAVQIAPGSLVEANRALLQDQIRSAVNQALDESRLLAARRLGPLSDGSGGP